MKNKIFGIIGFLLILFGVYLAVVENEAHFYTPFSIGLLTVSLTVYSKLFKESVFHKWRFSKLSLFFVLVLVSSVIMDIMGVKLGYWIYPYYDSIYDEILKYLFEWTVPLISYMVVFMIGYRTFSKKLSVGFSVLISLLTFVLISGIITEYVNSFVYSWKIVNMPLLDYNLGVFNLCFVTIGYWLMSLITHFIYSFLDKRLK